MSCTTHLFKIHIQFNGFEYIHRIVQLLLSSSRTFPSSPKETSFILAFASHFPNPTSSNSRDSLICFLFLRACLFCTFHTDKVIPYAMLCDWLLFPNIIFSRSIHFVACIHARSFLIAKYSLLFVHSFICWWTWGLFPFSDFMLSVLLGIHPGMESPGHIVNPMLILLRSGQTVFQSDRPVSWWCLSSGGPARSAVLAAQCFPEPDIRPLQNAAQGPWRKWGSPPDKNLIVVMWMEIWWYNKVFPCLWSGRGL